MFWIFHSVRVENLSGNDISHDDTDECMVISYTIIKMVILKLHIQNFPIQSSMWVSASHRLWQKRGKYTDEQTVHHGAEPGTQGHTFVFILFLSSDSQQPWLNADIHFAMFCLLVGLSFCIVSVIFQN